MTMVMMIEQTLINGVSGVHLSVCLHSVHLSPVNVFKMNVAAVFYTPDWNLVQWLALPLILILMILTEPQQ